jgi:hypothetical protein
MAKNISEKDILNLLDQVRHPAISDFDEIIHHTLSIN